MPEEAQTKKFTFITHIKMICHVSFSLVLRGGLEYLKSWMCMVDCIFVVVCNKYSLSCTHFFWEIDTIVTGQIKRVFNFINFILTVCSKPVDFCELPVANSVPCCARHNENYNNRMCKKRARVPPFVT